MKPRINMIGIITNQLPVMKAFYKDVLGFETELEMEEYVEFKNEGVRFALSTGSVMAQATGDQSYLESHTGHALELAFKCESPQDVDEQYKKLQSKGVDMIKPPADMPWNQRTAFFADPDGNIHELFCDFTS
jgi:lactoylglutathione lyase